MNHRELELLKALLLKLWQTLDIESEEGMHVGNAVGVVEKELSK